MTQIVSKMKTIRWQTMLVIILAVLVAVGTESCNKNTGKLTKKERKAQIEMYKKQMTEIVNGTSKLSLQDQERAVNEAVNKNFNDPELNNLIIQANQKIKAAYADAQRLHDQQIASARAKLYDLIANKDNLTADEMEKELNLIKAQKLDDGEIDELIGRVDKKIADMRASEGGGTIKSQLEKAFQGIADAAKAGNVTQANALVQSTVSKYFASENAPVLIIISKEGTIVDYDKPTTIKKYLDFCKDQKDSRNAVDSYQLDGAGKIKEIDLIKK
jgi:hypothetical protein